jgi:hypothetical protein
VRSRHFAILVALQDVDLPLQLLVLSVQEVDLALQFDDTLLILLVLVLQIDLLEVLNRGVEVVEAQDLLVADFDLVLEFLGELLLGGESLLHLVNDLVQLLAAVVGFPHLLGPLSLLTEKVLLDLHAHGDRANAVGIHLCVHTVALLHGVGKLHALSLLQQICLLLTIELAQAFHDLILTW